MLTIEGVSRPPPGSLVARRTRAAQTLPRGGRYWDRTSDLFRVREARYRCANRPRRYFTCRTRRRRESNPCTGLCRPLPKPLGHSASRPPLPALLIGARCRSSDRVRHPSSGRRDSNPRPSPWQGDALPTEPRPRAVEHLPPDMPEHHIRSSARTTNERQRASRVSRGAVAAKPALTGPTTCYPAGSGAADRSVHARSVSKVLCASAASAPDIGAGIPLGSWIRAGA